MRGDADCESGSCGHGRPWGFCTTFCSDDTHCGDAADAMKCTRVGIGSYCFPSCGEDSGACARYGASCIDAKGTGGEATRVCER